MSIDLKPPQLSEAEQRVAVYLGGRLTTTEIARVLHVSPNTVKVHLRHIYEKCGVSGSGARGRAAALLAVRKRAQRAGGES